MSVDFFSSTENPPTRRCATPGPLCKGGKHEQRECRGIGSG